MTTAAVNCVNSNNMYSETDKLVIRSPFSTQVELTVLNGYGTW